MKKTIFVVVIFFSLSRAFAGDSEQMNLLLNEGLRHARSNNVPLALRSFEGGLALARGVSNPRPRLSFLEQLGKAHAAAGNYPTAIYYFSEALQLAENSRRARDVVSLLTALGDVHRDMENYLKALSYYEDAMKLSKEYNYKNNRAFILAAAGDVYRHLGAFRKPVALFEEAMSAFKRLGMPLEAGKMQIRLGQMYAGIGDHATARAWYQSALKTGQARSSGELVSRAFAGTAASELLQGAYAPALSHAEKSLRSAEALNNPAVRIESSIEAGKFYLALYDYDTALDLFGKALETAKNIGDKRLQSHSLAMMGETYCLLREEEKAAACFDEASKVRRAAGMPAEATEQRLADMYLAQNDLARAEQKYKEISDDTGLGNVALARKNHKKAFVHFSRALKDALENRDLPALLAGYTGLGDVHSAQGDHRKAEENYIKAVALSEDQRTGQGFDGNLFSPEPRRERGVAVAPYEGMIRTLVAMGSPEEAFYYAEILKMGRFAALAACGRPLDQAASISPALKKEETESAMRIMMLRKDLRALYRTRTSESIPGVEGELKTAENKHAKVMERIKSLSPEYASVRYYGGIKPYEINLTDDEILLEFAVAGSATYLFMVEGKSKKVTVNAVALSRRELEETVSRYRDYHCGAMTDGSARRNFARDIKKLPAALFGPLLDNIPAGAKLVIVPDGPLSALPFGSLPLSGKNVSRDSGPPVHLDDRFDMMYAQSATSLTLFRSLKKNAAAGTGTMLMLDPRAALDESRAPRVSTGEDPAKVIKMFEAWQQRMAGSDHAGGTGSLFPRPGDNRQPSAGSLPWPDSVTVFSGSGASEANVSTLKSGNYACAILSVPLLLDRQLPYARQPSLVLSPGAAGGHHDGFLTMNKVINLRLPLSAVVLPRVDSLLAGTDLCPLEMSRAFHMAGAENVVVGLWRVPDDIVELLSMELVRSLNEGQDPHAALRAAQDKIREQGYDNPFYWAGFILSER